jgi:hypothetical protein
MHLQGTVKARVSSDGHLVIGVKALSGHPVVARATTKNVQTWKFAESPSTAFTVTFVYASEGNYRRDPVTKCDARVELQTHVTLSTHVPISLTLVFERQRLRAPKLMVNGLRRKRNRQRWATKPPHAPPMSFSA